MITFKVILYNNTLNILIPYLLIYIDRKMREESNTAGMILCTFCRQNSKLLICKDCGDSVRRATMCIKCWEVFHKKLFSRAGLMYNGKPKINFFSWLINKTKE